MNPSRFFLRGFVCLDCLISGSLALRLEPAGCPIACTAVLTNTCCRNTKLKITCYFLWDEIDCRLVKIQQKPCSIIDYIIHTRSKGRNICRV